MKKWFNNLFFCLLTGVFCLCTSCENEVGESYVPSEGGPVPPPPIYELSYVAIVEFHDSTYADRILAYQDTVSPQPPDYKLIKMIIKTNFLPKGFMDNPYNPWEKVMDNYYTVMPFYGTSDEPYIHTLWPLCSAAIDELWALSLKWTDIPQSNYTYGYETYIDGNGFHQILREVQWSRDSLMVNNPIKAVYKLEMDTVYSYYQIEPCMTPNKSAQYCEYIRQMLMEFKEQGKLEEFLEKYKIYPK